jgi:transcriptional regulator with PAS, ATPase and Fis domain
MTKSFNGFEIPLPAADILDNIDAGVLIYDALGNFIFMNTLMVNWRNIPRREYLRMNVHDFSGVLDVCVFDLVCQQKRRITRLQNYRDYQNVNSEIKVRIVTGTPIFDDYGNIKYVVMLLQDVQDFEDQYHSLLRTHKILSNGIEIGRKPKLGMVAKSKEILQLLSVTNNIALLDSTILLNGESGCGKEVFANYIHEHSSRKDYPIITVNCAAFPENLIEAELFGYEKGSFTGANKEGKIGLAEAANKGTLFLDEINSLPLSVQGKVLRMIEEKSVRKIGSLHAKNVDFRIIAATNKNLKKMVEEGTFRDDLYYRLNVIPLTIPPLRNRKDDIIPLCLHFLYYFCTKYNLQKSFSDEVLEDIRNYSWPGNVREIRNFVERMVVMTPSSTKEILSIPKGLLDNKKELISKPTEIGSPVYTHSSGKITKEQIIGALAVCNDNRAHTASYLGISRRQLQYKIKLFHIPSRCNYD